MSDIKEEEKLNSNNSQDNEVKRDWFCSVRKRIVRIPTGLATLQKRLSVSFRHGHSHEHEHKEAGLSDSKDEEKHLTSPTRRLKMSVQSAMLPHPEKQKKGGEDAFFVTEDGKAIGVADGVGGWAEKGVDPSLYARTLMKEAQRAHDELHVEDPRETLKIATIKANRIVGSSTACVLSVDDRDEKHIKLRSANIGDSGFLVIRDGDVFFRTKEQQFSFNFPYQLGSASRATANDAEVSVLELEEGDIIVMGTDGLFDNLFDEEIVQHINRAIGKEDPEKPSSMSNTPLTETSTPPRKPTNVAELLAKKAFDKARSPHCKTPFSKNAQQHGYLYPGGKMDDITVLVAQVVDPCREQMTGTLGDK